MFQVKLVRQSCQKLYYENFETTTARLIDVIARFLSERRTGRHFCSLWEKLINYSGAALRKTVFRKKARVAHRYIKQ